MQFLLENIVRNGFAQILLKYFVHHNNTKKSIIVIEFQG